MTPVAGHRFLDTEGIMRRASVVIVAVLGFFVVGVASGQEGHALKVLGSRTVTHVGVVVRDVDKVAKAWADVFGVEVTPVQEVKSVSFPKDYKGDRSAHPRIANVRFNNMTVELAQPVGGASPWRDFLDKYGEGIHHLAFSVSGLEDHVRLLESKGGRRALGEVGGSYAFVDLMPQFGLTIELTKAQAPSTLSTPGPPATSGMKAPARIGVMVRDGDAFRARYMELFDVPVKDEHSSCRENGRHRVLDSGRDCAR